MTTCTLNSHINYDLKSVQYDKGTGKYDVTLANPPNSCADGFFTNKNATVTVDPNITVAQLTYTNHPVILVPSKAMVLETNSKPSSFGGLEIFIVLALLGGAGYYAWKKGFFGGKPVVPSNSTPSSSIEDYPKYNSSAAPLTCANSSNAITPSFNRTNSGYAGNYYPSAVPGTTIINNGGHSDGLLTGMLLGEALSSHNNSSSVVHETDVIHDHDSYRSDDSSSRRASSYSSDDDTPSRSSSYTSDDSSSRYSSDDSSSSYSSDSSSSSYSSDSSSDSGSYSSDS